MEHIIQFGVTIDDDKIEKLVMEKASSECLKQVHEATKNYTSRGYYGDSESTLDKMFKDEVKRIVDENKESIIEKAVKSVTVNIMKTKAITEAKIKLVSSLDEEVE